MVIMKYILTLASLSLLVLSTSAATYTYSGALVTNILSIANSSTVNIQPGASITIPTRLRTGDSSGSKDTINQTGGTILCTGMPDSNYKLGPFVLGHWGSSVTTYNLSGGQLQVSNAEQLVNEDLDTLLDFGSYSTAKLGADGTGNINVSGTGVALFDTLAIRTGTLNIQAGGTVALGCYTAAPSALLSGSGALKFSGGTFINTAPFITNKAIPLTNRSTWCAQQDVVYKGAFSSTGHITLLSTNAQTRVALSGSSSHTGGTTITNVQVRAASAAALPGAVRVAKGGHLIISNKLTGNVTLQKGSAVTIEKPSTTDTPFTLSAIEGNDGVIDVYVTLEPNQQESKQPLTLFALDSALASVIPAGTNACEVVVDANERLPTTYIARRTTQGKVLLYAKSKLARRWNRTAGTWDNNAQNTAWLIFDEAAPYQDGDNVEFPDMGTHTHVAVNAPFAPEDLDVSSAQEYTFTRGTSDAALTPQTVSTGAGRVNFALPITPTKKFEIGSGGTVISNASDFAITAPISGTGTLIKAGSAALTVKESPDYTGCFTVRGGSLALVANSSGGAYRYLRWTITATRPDGQHINTGMQISEFALYDKNGTRLALTDASVLHDGNKTSNIPDGQFTKGEKVANLFDQNVSTKWYFGGGEGATTSLSSGGIHVVFDLGTTPLEVARYAFATANDANGRDPYSWTIAGSQDGATWQPLDTRSTQTFASRKTWSPQWDSVSTAASDFRAQQVIVEQGALVTSGRVTIVDTATFATPGKFTPTANSLLTLNAGFTGTLNLDPTQATLEEPVLAMPTAHAVPASQIRVPRRYTLQQQDIAGMTHYTVIENPNAPGFSFSLQ